MSPNYNYDPSKVSTTIEVLPAGRYEFKVGNPKAFAKEENGEVKNYGVRYSIEVAGGDKNGKRTVNSLYLHTEGAAGFAKQFQMACLGYKNNQAEEQRFNADHANDDWSFDPATGDCGDGWKQLAGTRVIGNVDVQANNRTGDPMQQFKNWETIS